MMKGNIRSVIPEKQATYVKEPHTRRKPALSDEAPRREVTQGRSG